MRSTTKTLGQGSELERSVSKVGNGRWELRIHATTKTRGNLVPTTLSVAGYSTTYHAILERLRARRADAGWSIAFDQLLMENVTR